MGEGREIGKAYQELWPQIFQILWKLSTYRLKKLSELQAQKIYDENYIKAHHNQVGQNQ